MTNANDDYLMETLVADRLARLPSDEILTTEQALETVREVFPNATEEDMNRALGNGTTARRNGRFVTW